MAASIGIRLAVFALIFGSAFITSCTLPAVKKAELRLAEKFAPQLRFDKAAATFPMSAQDYYNQVIETGLYKEKLNCDPSSFLSPQDSLEECRSRAYHNTERQSVRSGQYPSKVWQIDKRQWVPDGNSVKIPTYYKVFQCGNQIRILYWFFYGWQDRCAPTMKKISYHHGDWERILVTLSEDQSKIAAVTYFQHRGQYTRLAEGGDRDRGPKAGASYKPGFTIFESYHPVVYVGKQQHGSYHNEGGTGSGGVSFCGYFEDYRHNEGNQNLWLDTWNHLLSLEEKAEPWMVREALPDPKFRWGACEGGGESGCSIGQHPVKASNQKDICNLKACEGFATIVTDKSGIPLGGIATGGNPSACFESQCEFHDNQFGWTAAHPGTCSHCPRGYTDMGPLGCWSGLKRKNIHYYGLDYSLSTSDEGLIKSRP